MRMFLALALSLAALSAQADNSTTDTAWRPEKPRAPLLERLGVKDEGVVSNLSCGIPPIPPIGCKVGPCVCDQNGQNCQWTFICR